jgi:tetratricopeptide (TPR) repeat protein
MDSLRRSDDLEEWLYSEMDELKKDPVSTLPLLETKPWVPWRDARSEPERMAWFYYLANQGYYQLYRGNILRSINAYEQAYRFYFANPLRNADVVEYVLKPLGNNYTRLGDYERALFIQEKGLALAIGRKDSELIGSFYNNLAVSARWAGQLNRGADYGRKGLETVKKNIPLRGLLLSTLADIYEQSKNWDSAGLLVAESISVLNQPQALETNNREYWLLSAYQVRGNIAGDRGNDAAAIRSYEKGEEIITRFFRDERKREKAKLEVAIGNALLHQQESAEAMRHYDEALVALLPSFQAQHPEELPADSLLYGENTLLDALLGKAEAMLALKEPDAALHCYLLAFGVDRKLRLEFFSRVSKEQQAQESRRWAETAIGAAYESWQATGKKEYSGMVLSMAEMSKAQLLLDEMLSGFQRSRINVQDSLLRRQMDLIRAIAYSEREAAGQSEGQHSRQSADQTRKELQYELSLIEKRLRLKYFALESQLSELNPYNEEHLLQQIPASGRLLEYFAGQQNIYVIEAVKGNIDRIRKLEKAPEIYRQIENWVNRYFQQGPANQINDPKGYCSDAWALYRELCDTSWHRPGGVVLIPDGMIGYLPFDALITDSSFRPDPGQWPFLLKQTTFSFAYSLRTLGQQRKMERPGIRFAGFFLSYDSNARAAIPAVKKEYAEIERMVSGQFFLEEQASGRAFRENLPKANILHISTHAFLQGPDQLPVLQLADDRFYPYDLYGQEFQPQLLVLGACRTGYGMLAEGEGIISLSRAFTAAGAGGVIASLWNVNDESTAGLMGSFYRNLSTSPIPADALHSAKLEWLAQLHDNPLLNLPYFWAGSIYIGSDAPVQIQLKSTSISWYALAALAFAVFFLIYCFIRLRSRRERA